MSNFISYVENFLDQADNVVAEKTAKIQENLADGKNIFNGLHKSSSEQDIARDKNEESDDQDAKAGVERLKPDKENKIEPEEEIVGNDSPKEEQASKSTQSSPVSPKTLPPERKSSSSFSINKETQIQVEVLKAELQSLEEQNTGLKSLWNKTRSEKKKVHDLLVKSSAKHKKELDELDAEWEEKAREIEVYCEEKIRAVKLAHSEEKRQFELALKTKNEAHQELLGKLQEVESESRNQDGESEQLKERINELQEEKEDLIRHQASIAQEHADSLEHLRADFIKREETVRKEINVKLSNRDSLQSHQGQLEQEIEESTNLLAKAQLDAQEINREKLRLEGETRFLKSDNKALKDQIRALKNQENLTQKQISDLKTQIKEKNNSLSDIRTEHNQQILKLKHKIQEQNITLMKKMPKNDNSELENLKKRHKTVTSSLLEKAGQLEKLKHERNQLDTLLQESQQRVHYLKNQIHKMETDEDIELGGVSAASSSPSKSFGLRRRRGGFQLTAEGPTSSPTLNMGINILDSLGAQLAVLMRRHMAVRSGFITYILLLHLWVFVILYHWHHSIS